MNTSAIERILQDLIRIGEARGSDGAGFAVIGRNHLVEPELAGPHALAERFALTPDARAVLLNCRLESERRPAERNGLCG